MRDSPCNTDNWTYRELQYDVIKINDFIDTDFMRARYVDSLGNWRRTPRLWDASATTVYEMGWNLPLSTFPIQRQYVNWEKTSADGCGPANHGTRRCIDLQVSPVPWFQNDLYVKLKYEDPPLNPQPPLNRGPIPWINPSQGPFYDDNQGGGAGFSITPDGTKYPEIIILVPCTGVAEAFFHTSSFGGDNYTLMAKLYKGYPEPNDANLLFGPLKSAQIEVWRFLNIAVCSMNRPWWLLNNPPSFYPPNNLVAVPFREAYIELYIYDLFQSMQYADPVLENHFEFPGEGSDWDYVDDLPPDGPGMICNYQGHNERFNTNPQFHDSFLECRTPYHTIQATGINRYPGDAYLGLTPGYDDKLDIHYHIFIGLGTIWRTKTPDQYHNAANKVFCHELGHIIAVLHEGGDCEPQFPECDIMKWDWDPTKFLPLHFSNTDLEPLRQGPSCDERVGICPNCP